MVGKRKWIKSMVETKISIWMPDLLEYVHAQVGGEVGDRLTTEVGQRNLRKRLRAQRFSLFVAFQTHVLQKKHHADDVRVASVWTSEHDSSFVRPPLPESCAC